MDTENWSNPILNIAYSRGKPSGQTVAGKHVFNLVLVDESRTQVPCVLSHTTCRRTKYIFFDYFLMLSKKIPGQGSKVCPRADTELLSLPHTSAMRADVKERLQNAREQRLQLASPSKDIFMQTVAYLAAIQKLGCSHPLTEETFLLASEEEERNTREVYLQQIQRGYRMREGIFLLTRKITQVLFISLLSPAFFMH